MYSFRSVFHFYRAPHWIQCFLTETTIEVRDSSRLFKCLPANIAHHNHSATIDCRARQSHREHGVSLRLRCLFLSINSIARSLVKDLLYWNVGREQAVSSALYRARMPAMPATISSPVWEKVPVQRIGHRDFYCCPPIYGFFRKKRGPCLAGPGSHVGRIPDEGSVAPPSNNKAKMQRYRFNVATILPTF